LRTVDDLTDEQAGAASRLPGWTRAEVVTHLARNADGVRNMVEAAARGEVADMYPGGADARAAGILAGRGQRAAVLRADVRQACDRLMDAWGALRAGDWDRMGRMISGEYPMHYTVWSRWREVEVHHVDLDSSYEASDWPVQFVSGALDEVMATFDRRASSSRPRVDAEYRIVTTDHDRVWRVALHGAHVGVAADDGAPADGEVRGWGCDVAAWLYGRDPRGGGILASGDLGVLRLPQWFPFA